MDKIEDYIDPIETIKLLKKLNQYDKQSSDTYDDYVNTNISNSYISKVIDAMINSSDTDTNIFPCEIKETPVVIPKFSCTVKMKWYIQIPEEGGDLPPELSPRMGQIEIEIKSPSGKTKTIAIPTLFNIKGNDYRKFINDNIFYFVVTILDNDEKYNCPMERFDIVYSTLHNLFGNYLNNFDTIKKFDVGTIELLETIIITLKEQSLNTTDKNFITRLCKFGEKRYDLIESCNNISIDFSRGEMITIEQLAKATNKFLTTELKYLPEFNYVPF